MQAEVWPGEAQGGLASGIDNGSWAAFLLAISVLENLELDGEGGNIAKGTAYPGIEFYFLTKFDSFECW